MGIQDASHRSSQRALASLLVLSMLAGCSSQGNAPHNTTEEDLHSSDFGRHLTEPSHAFVCQDGTRLLLLYKSDGLAIEIRREADSRPTLLRAPAQGEPFVGANLTAVMRERKLILHQPGRSPLTCIRQTIG